MSKEQILPIDKMPTPSSGSNAGAEGNISISQDYFYIFASGQWIRVPVNNF